jgi:hypothetical protein
MTNRLFDDDWPEQRQLERILAGACFGLHLSVPKGRSAILRRPMAAAGASKHK